MSAVLLFAGLPGGIEMVVVVLIVVLLLAGAFFYTLYRLFSWVKGIIESAAGADEA